MFNIIELLPYNLSSKVALHFNIS